MTLGTIQEKKVKAAPGAGLEPAPHSGNVRKTADCVSGGDQFIPGEYGEPEGAGASAARACAVLALTLAALTLTASACAPLPSSSADCGPELWTAEHEAEDCPLELVGVGDAGVATDASFDRVGGEP